MADYFILMVIGCVILMVTVNGEVFPDDARLTECFERQNIQDSIADCKNSFKVVPEPKSPVWFFTRDTITSYCRSHRIEYMQYAICYNSIYVNCFKEYGVEELALSNSELEAAINYLCDRVDGGLYDLSGCELNDTEHDICNRQFRLDTPLPSDPDPTSYGAKQLRLCWSSTFHSECIRRNEMFKATCPDKQYKTYSTVLQKIVPAGCKELLPNGCHNLGFNIILMLITATITAFVFLC